MNHELPRDERGREIARLYDAICEGRRTDAIDSLKLIFPAAKFRTLAEQRNLFPDRIPE